MKSDLDIAKCYLTGCGYSLVVVKECVELVSRERGILPLLMIYDKCPDKLDGASLADKAIGKAAAFILAETKIKEVYAEVLSEPAVTVFERRNIRYSYGKLVPQILNRDGSGLCPMEKACIDIDEPMDGIMAVTAFICCNSCGPGSPKDMQKGNCKCT